MKRAVILYGAPGAGKGTQAELLETKFGFFHFDTGRYIERVVHDPINIAGAEIQKEKRAFDEGSLCTPTWVLKIIKEETERIAQADWDIVFSGSPRTVFEAFGDAGNEGLYSLLAKHYERKNIFIFELKIDEADSLRRNSQRMICSVCGLMVLAEHKDLQKCPFCGAAFYRRTLDRSEVIKVRWGEYLGRTYPILERLEKEKYQLYQIDGTPPPYKVFENVVSKLV